MNRAVIVLVVLAVGCSSPPAEPPQTKGDDPGMKALGDAENAEYEERALKEADRLFAEVADVQGKFGESQDSVDAYYDLKNQLLLKGQYKAFYERVKDKKITDFAPPGSRRR